MPVISFIRYFKISEGHIPYRSIKEAVRKIYILKAAYGYAFFLVKLTRDAPAYLVKLHTIKPAACHTFREHAHEISDTAGRFKYVPSLKSHPAQHLIYRICHSFRCVKGGQSRFSCCCIFLFCKELFQLLIFRAPPAVRRIESFRYPAPSCIPCKYLLLTYLCKSPFFLQFFQKPDRLDVLFETLLFTCRLRIFIDPVVSLFS